MRAVNLIPGESGRASGGSVGAFALLGMLAVLLVGALAYVLTNNLLVERRAELASLTTQAQTAQRQAEAVRPYREFAALAKARVETVRQLGASRFDWHRAFDELAQVVPDDVWLVSLLGTVTTGVSVDGGTSGSTAALRSALPNPAIELSGCTTSQEKVARMISKLRLMTDVVRVTLADTSKDESNGTEDCRHGNAGFPQFGIVVFFETPPAPPAPPAADAAASSTPAPAATGAAASGSSSSTGGEMR